MSRKPHILFLTHYFPPELNAPANRTYEHCKEWTDEVDVTIITNVPNHPDGKIFKGYKNKLVQHEKVDGINVTRLWTFITPNEGLILRTLNYVIFMMLSVFYVLVANKSFDIVIATSPQFFCGLAGKYISKLKRKPFILEIRDLWPESIIAVGALTNKPIIKLLENIELRLYKSANQIVSVTESFKNNMISKGIDADKIKVLYNGVSTDIFSNGKTIEDSELRSFLHGGYKIGYIGTIGLAHSISTLIKAAEKLKETQIKFVIVGSGAEKEKIESEIITKRLKNIKIFPLQPKEGIPTIINHLDIFLVHLKKDPLFKTVIPSKLFEGMVMKKPILIGVDGEAREIVEKAHCGVYFEPENYDELVEKILYLSKNTAEANQLGINGYNYVIINFDRSKIASQFLAIGKGLLS